MSRQWRSQFKVMVVSQFKEMEVTVQGHGVTVQGHGCVKFQGHAGHRSAAITRENKVK